MKEILLFSAAGLFILILLFRLIRGVILGRDLTRGGNLDTDTIPAELRQPIRDATTPVKGRELMRQIERRAASLRAVERASFYFASGELALTVLKRPLVATRFYIRALRNDPACESALDRLVAILLAQKNFRLLERTCWSLLSRMDDDYTGSPVWVKCWTALGSLYSAHPQNAERSDAIRKMLNGMLDGPADEEAGRKGSSSET